MARRIGKPLDRGIVIAAAFALLAEGGLSALSMRRLADRLQVQAPALYWHFKGKPELLALMATEVYAQARAAVRPSQHWREWLIGYGTVLHDALRSGRDLAQLCAIARPLEGGSSASATAIAEPLTTLGLEQAAALSAIASVTSLALGWSMFEANGPMHSYLEDMIDIDQSFREGLTALTDGLKGP